METALGTTVWAGTRWGQSPEFHMGLGWGSLGTGCSSDEGARDGLGLAGSMRALLVRGFYLP